MKNQNPPSSCAIPPRTHSNHHPILVRCVTQVQRERQEGNFIMEANWLVHEDFGKLVNESWDEHFGDLQYTMNRFVARVKWWQTEVFGHTPWEKKKKKGDA